MKNFLRQLIVVYALSLGGYQISVAQEITKQQVETVKSKASAGNAGAQYELGNMYMQGEGVPFDELKAIRWYEKSAAQDNVEAQFTLGKIYERELKDDLEFERETEVYEKAIGMYEKAAEKGHVRAQYYLGTLYLEGLGNLGLLKNNVKGIGWLEQAADQDYASAYFDLGSIYIKGEIVRQNYEKSRELFEKAGDLGIPMAYMRIGIMYAQGEGVHKNRSIAKEWYGQACDGGLEFGCRAYRVLNEDGF